MQRKKKKKHVRAGFVSDIKIKNKVIIIFVLLIICIAIMFYGAAVIVYSLIDENRKENEQMITSSADEYINTEIENMVSIAKTVYTNEALYEFLNNKYATTVDYYDRYYDFSQSRFLVVTEDSAVRQFKIYTANDTVMNGGNIGRIDTIENEEWYRYFRQLDRDMIIYCSSDQKNLSLIRKLDYKRVHTGAAVIKIDFNTANLQSKFLSMYFDGRVYVASGDTLLYGNQKDMTMPDSDTLKNYTKKSRNFYTCDIDYYVYSNSRRVMSIFAVPMAVPLILSFFLCFILVITIINDIKNRIMEVCAMCVNKRKASVDRQKDNLGEDEIGRLYRDVNNTLIDLNRLKDEKDNLSRFIRDYKLKTNDVIIAALNYETRQRFELKTPEEAGETVTLDEELLNLSRMLDRLKEREYFSYSLISDTTSAVKNIIPFSLSAIALHVAEYEGVGHDVEIDVREHDGCFSIRYYKQGVALSPADILKLRAIFEPESAKSLPAFEAEEEFNSYVRLSRFYLDNITLNINSKEELDFEFIITNVTD